MIRSQNLNNAFFSSANDGSLEEILETIGFQDQVATMDQTHSSKIAFADSNISYKCDGIYTNKIKLPLVVKTADCVPLLMESSKGVSATHAGWRGLEKSIFEKSLDIHEISSLKISIGPHARKCCYEVKEDLESNLSLKPYCISKDKKINFEFSNKQEVKKELA
jgi:copper oxidase (laccase) domain-containing protein